jgi:hypothetical protein
MDETIRILEPFSLEKVGLRDGGLVYKLGLVFAGLPEKLDDWADFIPKERAMKVVAPSREVAKISFKGLDLTAGVHLTPILTFDKDGGLAKIQINSIANIDPSGLSDVLRQIAVAIDAGAGGIEVMEMPDETDGSSSADDADPL